MSESFWRAASGGAAVLFYEDFNRRTVAAGDFLLSLSFWQAHCEADCIYAELSWTVSFSGFTMREMQLKVDIKRGHLVSV